MKYTEHRSSRGQAIAETAAALPVLIAVVVAGLALVWNAGALIYSQAKLAFICQQSAIFAAQQLAGQTQGSASDFATTLGKQLGLPLTSITITSPIAVPSANAAVAATQEAEVQVTASAPLFFKIFGSAFTIKEIAFAPVPQTQFNGYDALIQVLPTNAAFTGPANLNGLAFAIPAFSMPSPGAIQGNVPNTTTSANVVVTGIFGTNGNPGNFTTVVLGPGLNSVTAADVNQPTVPAN